jgi:hypothetical protein
MSLVKYLDELVDVARSGGRLEDALRSVAMRVKGLDPIDWKMRHQPPIGLEDGAKFSKLDDIYPADVYTRPRIYGSSPEEISVASLARMVRGQDDAMVPMYRAVPRWASDIGTGEWVTPSIGYARRHADLIRRPDNPTVILAGRAKAGDLLTEGNSLAEYGYMGNPIMTAARVGAPRIPKRLMQAAREGDPAAVEQVAKLYGLEALMRGYA